jgi:hypothetical protein
MPAKAAVRPGRALGAAASARSGTIARDACSSSRAALVARTRASSGRRGTLRPGRWTVGLPAKRELRATERAAVSFVAALAREQQCRRGCWMSIKPTPCAWRWARRGLAPVRAQSRSLKKLAKVDFLSPGDYGGSCARRLAGPTAKGGAMRRLLVLVSIWATALLSVAAVASPAQGSIPPGTNGKIVFGQVFPNYGVTTNPDGSDVHQIGPVGSTTCNTWSPDSSKVLCNLWSPDGVRRILAVIATVVVRSLRSAC